MYRLLTSAGLLVAYLPHIDGLDRPISKQPTVTQQSGDTITASVSQSIWTYRTAIVVGLFSFAVIASLYHHGRSDG
jgi:hypothetical protein